MPESTTPPRPQSHLIAAWMVAATCVILILVELPLTLRRPLTADCTLWDLQWRNFVRGGVPYRDIFETNPPGTLWIHGLARTCLGTSSEAMRWIDLLLVGSVIANLAMWMRRLERHWVVTWGLAAALVWIYGWQSIWCQCQRDLWMLAPCLVAMNQHWRRAASADQVFWRSLVEGAWWGLAVWIKPLAFVPASCVWLAGQFTGPPHQRPGVEFLGLVAGGMAIGLTGMAWMQWAGCWSWYVDTLWNWNGAYFASRTPAWLQLPALLVHFGPWMLVHVLATIVACSWLRQPPVRSSIAALYLGWMLQAFVLQHGHGYVHLPEIMLGVAILVGEPVVTGARLWWPAVATVLATTLWMSPLARFEHLPYWWQCVTGPIDAELRMTARGPLDRVYPCAADEAELHDVAQYLRNRGVRDGEVCAYEYSAMRLYWDLDLAPPCRFVCPRIYAFRFFPARRDDIHQLLAQSPQRFVVTDLVMDGMSEADANGIGPDGPHSPPPKWPREVPKGTRSLTRLGSPRMYPWSHPVVFRSGRYLVHELDGPMGEFTARPPWQTAPSASDNGVP